MNIKKRNLLSAIRLWALGNEMEEITYQCGTDLTFKKGNEVTGFIVTCDRDEKMLRMKMLLGESACDYVYLVSNDVSQNKSLLNTILAECGLLCYDNIHGLGMTFQVVKSAAPIPYYRRKRAEPCENDFTFDTVNHPFAVSVCKAIAEKTDDSPRLLWLYGPTGCGKTHLLFAAYNHSQHESNLYCAAKICAKEICKNFRKEESHIYEIEQSDLLIIDTLDDWINKTSTQEHFAKLILEKVAKGQRVLLASQCHPGELKEMHTLLGKATVTAAYIPLD